MTTILIEHAVRSSIVLAVGLATSLAMRRSSASLRHAVLATSLAAAALVVPMSHVTPLAFAIPLGPPAITPAPLTDARAVTAVVGGAGGSAPAADPWPSVAASVAAGWLAGFVLLAVHRTRALLDLRRAASAATPLTEPSWATLAAELASGIGLVRPVRLLQTDRAGLLATWGHFAPRLVVPAHARRWKAEKVRVVLAHELEHVRRRDWIVQLAADLVRDANWWNPLFWWTCRRLRLESERACDDAVLRAGVAPAEYARHLVEIARACGRARVSHGAAAAMARRSTLHRRIDAMLNPRLSRAVAPLSVVVLVVLSGIAIGVPVAGLRAQDAASRALTGVVYDPGGSVLPDVDVTLEDAQAARSTARTDAAGRFTFGSVPPGKYVLKVALPGFKALAQSVQLRQPRDWAPSLVLQVGDVQETITVRSARIGKPPAAAAPAKVRVGGSIRPPRKLKDVRPEYPESMRSAGEEGTVLLDTIIATDGSVQSIRVVPSPVHQALADAAVAAVRQWRFEPTLLNGSPVEVVMRVSINFGLESE